MNTNVATPTTVPFSKLKAPDDINARLSGKSDGIHALASSILAKGLILSLAVRPSKKGDEFEVIDGRRRFKAIALLVKAKKVPKDYPVAVMVRNEDNTAALETSLMANVVQLPMHPVDQHEVFARLVNEKVSESDIAARFGLEERQVRQHLALGRLAPEIRAAWRAGKLDAKTAKLFTAAKSAEHQARVYNELSDNGEHGVSDYQVRSALIEGRLKTDDPRYVAIGRSAYEAAGGRITEDLFATESYLEDPDLLDGLFIEHLSELCARFVADGWGWASLSKGLPSDWRGWRTLKQPTPDLTTAEQERIAEIEAAIKADNDRDYDDNDDEDEDGFDFDAARSEQRAIERAGIERAYSLDDKRKAGVVIEVSQYNHRISIFLGCIKPRPKRDAGVEDASDDAAGELEAPAAKGPFEISAALVETVTRTQTEAVGRVLAVEPDLALRCLIAALQTTYDCPLKISIGHSAPLNEIDSDEFEKTIKKAVKMSEDALLPALARLVSYSVNLISQNVSCPRDNERRLVALLPGEAYLLAAREAFNAVDYFDRASKPTADAALGEMVKSGVITAGDLPAPGSKKKATAEVAAAKAKAHGWLPPELRHPDYAIGNSKPKGKRGKSAASEAVAA